MNQTTSMKQVVLSRLQELGIKPSKGLGQNFLIDTTTYSKIVEAAELKAGEAVLEVGPGLGTLTERIAEKGAQVFAVEKDRKLISFLKELLGSKVTIIEADALKFNPAELGLKKGGYKVVANIPYYITGQLLKNIYEVWPRPSTVVLLLQKEVAQRMVAKPPHSNILALTVQYFAEPKIISYITKYNFYPAPKVDSAIIRLTTKKEEGIGSVENAQELFKTIKTGFSSKRKKLINNLSAGFKLSKEQINVILKEAGIAENVRAENLTLIQWQKLTDTVRSRHSAD